MKPALLALLLLCACCATAAAFGKSDLLGDWRYYGNSNGCHYRFRPDGTFSGEVYSSGVLSSKFAGNWSVTGDILRYVYTSDDLGRIPVGTRDRDQLLSVGKNAYRIKAADGSVREYKRIRPSFRQR